MSRRVTWKAELAASVSSRRASGFMPRSRVRVSSSMTIATEAAPTIRPWRRRSKGRAASETFSLVVAVPEARKPGMVHSWICSLVISSAAITITRLHLPARIQDSAMWVAWVVEAQAALMCMDGPLAPTHWANWLSAIGITFSRKFWLNVYGSLSAPGW